MPVICSIWGKPSWGKLGGEEQEEISCGQKKSREAGFLEFFLSFERETDSLAWFQTIFKSCLEKQRNIPNCIGKTMHYLDKTLSMLGEFSCRNLRAGFE